MSGCVCRWLVFVYILRRIIVCPGCGRARFFVLGVLFGRCVFYGVSSLLLVVLSLVLLACLFVVQHPPSTPCHLFEAVVGLRSQLTRSLEWLMDLSASSGYPRSVVWPHEAW